MADYLPAPDALLSFLRSLLVFVFEGPLLSLLFLGVVFRIAGQHVASNSPWPQRFGLFAFLAVCLLGFLTLDIEKAQIGLYLLLGFRALLVLLIVEGMTVLVLPLIGWAWSMIRRPFHWGRSSVTWFRQSVSRFIDSRRPTAPLPIPIPPPTIEELIAQADREYEAKCQALRSARMDMDEREAALLFAKQKYLRRIHEITNQ